MCFNNCSFPCGSRWSDIALFLIYFFMDLFSLCLLWIPVKQGKMQRKVWTAAEGTHIVGSLYQFISLLSHDTLSKEKHIIGRNSYFVCVCGLWKTVTKKKKLEEGCYTRGAEFWQSFLSFQIMQVFCYNFICLGGCLDIIWHVSSWGAAGDKRVEPAGMFGADLERSKAIQKLGELGDISLWTEVGKPRSRITPVSGKVGANLGQDIIFALENNHIFSSFLLWCHL